MLPPSRLAELRGLVERAGPVDASDTDFSGEVMRYRTDGSRRPMFRWGLPLRDTREEADAVRDAAVASVNSLPALLDALDEREALLRECRADLDYTTVRMSADHPLWPMWHERLEKIDALLSPPPTPEPAPRKEPS